MIPMLLLAALVDPDAERARRAALHEVARRTEPEAPPPELADPETPPFGALMMAGVRLHLTEGSNTKIRKAIDLAGLTSRVGYFLEDALKRFTDCSLVQIELEASRIPIPASEEALYFDTIRSNRPVPWAVRTDADPILAAFWAVDIDTKYLISLSQNAASVADWLKAEHPNLTGWSAERILAASEAWHARFRAALFRAPCPKALVLLRYPDGWTLQRLTEKTDLAAEGASMGHCVGGPPRKNGRPDGESVYWQTMREDKSSILSLRDPENVPHATLELVNKVGRIVQVQGPEDRLPSRDVLQRIRLALHRLSGWREAVPVANVILSPYVVERGPFFQSVEFQKARSMARHLEKALKSHGPTQQVSLVFRVLDTIRGAVLEMKRRGKAIVFPSGRSLGWARTGAPEGLTLPASFGTPLGGFMPATEPVVDSASGGAFLWLFWSGTVLTFWTWYGSITFGAVLHVDLEDLLYQFTGFERTVPSTSDLVVALPGQSSWAMTRLPIVTARAMRAAQAATPSSESS